MERLLHPADIETTPFRTSASKVAASYLDATAPGYSRTVWDYFCDHIRDIPWKDEWAQVGLDVNNRQRKY